MNGFARELSRVLRVFLFVFYSSQQHINIWPQVQASKTQVEASTSQEQQRRCRDAIVLLIWLLGF